MYLKFLQALLALGPKLPAILAWLQTGYELFKDLFPAQATRALVTPKIAAVEKKVLTAANKGAVSASRGLLDFAAIRQLYDWLERSGLLAVLMLLLSRPKD